MRGHIAPAGEHGHPEIEHAGFAAEVHDGEKLLQYVIGHLAEEERGTLEQHLVECPACFNKVAIGRGLRVHLGELDEEEWTPKGSHPNKLESLTALAEDKLSEESARKLREHVLSCPNCLRAFHMLRGLETSQEQP
jgi:hypothetical protein